MRNHKVYWVAICAAVLWSAGLANAQAPTADAKKRGGEILADAANASGGESLKKVESLQYTAAGNINSPMGEVAAEIKTQMVYPDRLRLEVTVQGNSFSQGFDGKTAWASSQQGSMDLPAEFSGEALRGVDLAGGIGLYKKALAGKAEAEFAGEKDFAGQKALLVEWTGPTGKVKLYFDPATKLLAGAKYQAATMQGAVEEERRLSDYRELDGVKFPHHWVTYRDGTQYSDITIKDLKVNEKLDAGIFAKPQ